MVRSPVAENIMPSGRQQDFNLTWETANPNPQAEWRCLGCTVATTADYWVTARVVGTCNSEQLATALANRPAQNNPYIQMPGRSVPADPFRLPPGGLLAQPLEVVELKIAVSALPEGIPEELVKALQSATAPSPHLPPGVGGADGSGSDGWGSLNFTMQHVPERYIRQPEAAGLDSLQPVTHPEDGSLAVRKVEFR
jgi:hypothetical protein